MQIHLKALFCIACSSRMCVLYALSRVLGASESNGGITALYGCYLVFVPAGVNLFSDTKVIFACISLDLLCVSMSSMLAKLSPRTMLELETDM